MAVYQIRINEKMKIGKSVVSFLQSIPQVVTFEMPKKKEVNVSVSLNNQSELYHGLNSAFAEVRLMLDGKKKEKSAQEFLEELRKERGK
jgi:hypothetical protein